MARIGDLITPFRRSTLSRFERLLCCCLIILSLLCLIFFGIIVTRPRQDALIDANVCLTPICVKAAAQLLEQIDESVSPCQDFYQFACGGMEKQQVIPEDRTNMWSGSLLQLKIDKSLKESIENLSAIDSENHHLWKMKTFYEQCMDKNSSETLASRPLELILQEIGGWPVIDSNFSASDFDLTSMLVSLKHFGFDADLFSEIKIRPHLLAKEYNIIYLGEASLSLEDASYYRGKDLNDTILQAYYNFMMDSALILGASLETAKKDMIDVLEFEMSLVKIMRPEDSNKTIFNPMKIDKLNDVSPAINWTKFFTELCEPYVMIPPGYDVIVKSPEYLTALSDLLTKTDKRVIMNYIGVRVIMDMTGLLDDIWSRLARKLYRHIDGRNQLLQRWKYCINIVKKYFALSASSLYVQSLSDVSEQIRTVTEMIVAIKEKFLENLKTTGWMDSETMEAAANKTKAMKSYIGYPKLLLNDTALDLHYELLNIRGNVSFFVNMLTARRWLLDMDFLKLQRENVPGDWEEYGNVVNINAYYRPSQNSIQFPISIIHAFEIRPEKPMYLNYGSIGWVIGHEITHGFDNNGRLFDETGALKDWWSNETSIFFKNKTKCFAKQYGEYTSGTGLKIRGDVTLGENIADNGGLKQAYGAYDKYLTSKGDEMSLPGLQYNARQLFFIQSSYFYCGKWRKALLDYLIRTDVHSPNRIRVIGTMSNSKEFSDVFGCSKNSPMNPQNKCALW